MLIAVDKSLNLSSFDIVRRMKHEFPKEKIWHSWTLDPKATWLMILWVGKWTKQLATLIWLDKIYETIIDFSKMSDTRDMWFRDKYEEYQILDNNKWIIKDWKEIIAPSLEEIKENLDLLIPSSVLPLPSFSAKKKDWKRMYNLARDGKVLNEEREMKVCSYDILEYDFPKLRLSLNVWSWTYIRSIWYWLWQQFWLGWILTELRRLKVGERDLRDMQLDYETDYHMHGQEWSFKWKIIEE